MVSTRPSPRPARGRVPYPKADTYTPGDAGVTPALNNADSDEGPTSPTSPPPRRPASPQVLPSQSLPIPAPTDEDTSIASSPNDASSSPSNATSAATAASPNPADNNPTATPAVAAPSEGEMGKEGGVGGGLRRLTSVRRKNKEKDKEAAAAAAAAASASAAGKDAQPQQQQQVAKEQPLPPTPKYEMSEREKSTAGLRTWWKTFTQREGSPPTEKSFRRTPRTMTMNTRRVFGVPLARVLTYAAMQISTSAPDGSLYVWGEVPIIVGRCGGYLKNKTEIQGVFRISGSAKRMRELQAMFDEGPTYGIDVNWETSQYTPHDVATILRRYLTQMPQPVIPIDLYNDFRMVHVSERTPEDKTRVYKHLIRQMPRENLYLLLYLLDLLGIFARDSDKNLMTAANLAVIFQPGILSHPGHEMRPAESAVSKGVVEFLIDYQASFVFGMSKSMSHSMRKPAQPKAQDASVQASAESSARPSAEAKRRGSSESKRRPSLEPPSLSPGLNAANAQSPGGSRAPSPFIPPESIPEDRPADVPLSRGPSPLPPTAEEPEGNNLPAKNKGKGKEVASNAAASAAGAATTVPAKRSAMSPASDRPLSPTATQSDAKSRPSAELVPPRPPAVRADTDFMIPSDSDDDTPSGGYYIVERTTSPHRATSPLPDPPKSSAANVLQSIIPPRRPTRKRPPPPLAVSPPPEGKGMPAIDVMDPSDSDDDVPEGGYVVYENARRSPASINRSASSRLRSRSETPGLTPQTAGASLGRSRTVLQPADARANSPKRPTPSADAPGGTGLSRRRTLPSKRVSDFTARMRRAVREA